MLTAVKFELLISLPLELTITQSYSKILIMYTTLSFIIPYITFLSCTKNILPIHYIRIANLPNIH
jgi:hypothetical protein